MDKQPDIDVQRLLDSLADDKPTEVSIPNTNKKYRVSWIKGETLRKVSALQMSSKKDARFELQISCKIASLFILNNYWKIRLKYWFLWRWFYYVRQYSDFQLLPIIEEGKKKVVPIASWMVMTSLQGFSDTLATMSREEVRSLQERSLGKGAN